MDQISSMALTFRCAPELDKILPRPIPAVLGLPDWFKAMPQRTFNPSIGKDDQTVKRCPPFIDAMTYGFLIPLAVDLEVRDGEFSWNFEGPAGVVGDVAEFPQSPIDFHDPSQVVGTPFFDEDRFVIKFNNFWTIEAPAGYSLLFGHPANRADLPFTTLAGLVDADRFHNFPIQFPARWHKPDFNGVLPKGTPIAQCMPVKREGWTARFDVLSAEDTAELVETRVEILRQPGYYRRQFRAPKR
jgi:hypothetical protein